jgi:hypothetical protein
MSSDDFWSNLFMGLLWIFLASLVGLFITYVIVPKHTIGYSLSGNPGTTLAITREIEWYADEDIDLDKTVSYWDAIRMIDSLNNTLKK